jgi:transcriptional antiterminator NusG
MNADINRNAAPWYLLQVQSNFEDKVADRISAGIAEKQLGEFIHQVLVPKEEVKSVKDGKSVLTKRKLYPGYVLVQATFNDQVWHFLKKTDKVLGFIGGAKPTPMKDSDVDRIFVLMESSESTPKHKIEFQIGQTVRVNEGPFKDFNGTIDSVDYNRSRLKVVVLIFGRATPVELTFSDVVIE